MIAITMYKTRDGVLHATQEQAKRHAEKAYGEALSNMAHKLIQIDKYSAMCEKLDEDGFHVNIAVLAALKADIEPIEQQEE